MSLVRYIRCWVKAIGDGVMSFPMYNYMLVKVFFFLL
jgi:hypothetical protein